MRMKSAIEYIAETDFSLLGPDKEVRGWLETKDPVFSEVLELCPEGWTVRRWQKGITVGKMITFTPLSNKAFAIYE